jgi:hypothetical protein
MKSLQTLHSRRKLFRLQLMEVDVENIIHQQKQLMDSVKHFQ